MDRDDPTDLEVLEAQVDQGGREDQAALEVRVAPHLVRVQDLQRNRGHPVVRGDLVAQGALEAPVAPRQLPNQESLQNLQRNRGHPVAREDPEDQEGLEVQEDLGAQEGQADPEAPGDLVQRQSPGNQEGKQHLRRQGQVSKDKYTLQT